MGVLDIYGFEIFEVPPAFFYFYYFKFFIVTFYKATALPYIQA